jgi:hypothetical protein
MTENHGRYRDELHRLQCGPRTGMPTDRPLDICLPNEIRHFFSLLPLLGRKEGKRQYWKRSYGNRSIVRFCLVFEVFFIAPRILIT